MGWEAWRWRRSVHVYGWVRNFGFFQATGKVVMVMVMVIVMVVVMIVIVMVWSARTAFDCTS